jgi:hypothetical protein
MYCKYTNKEINVEGSNVPQTHTNPLVLIAFWSPFLIALAGLVALLLVLHLCGMFSPHLIYNFQQLNVS